LNSQGNSHAFIGQRKHVNVLSHPSRNPNMTTQVAIITGASRGIGAVVAKEMRGRRITVNAHTHP
jgi:hypothetical protein